MGIDRRGDGDGVDIRIVDQLGGRGGDFHSRIEGTYLLEPRGRPVADRRHPCVAAGAEVADEIRPPIAVSHHPDLYHSVFLLVEPRRPTGRERGGPRAWTPAPLPR